jgi:hypothetical protein
MSELHKNEEMALSDLEEAVDDPEELMKGLWKLEKKGWSRSRVGKKPPYETYISLSRDGREIAGALLEDDDGYAVNSKVKVMYATLLAVAVVAVCMFALAPFPNDGGQDARMEFVVFNDYDCQIQVDIKAGDGTVIASEIINPREYGVYSYVVEFGKGEKSKQVSIVHSAAKLPKTVEPTPHSVEYTVNSGETKQIELEYSDEGGKTTR